MSTQVRLGMIMDPIAKITPHKDSSFAMLLAAQKRGWELRYIEPQDLFLYEGQPFATSHAIEVRDNNEDWFSLSEPAVEALDSLDLILMRQDPPFDQEYLYTTHLLSLAEGYGVRVINSPQALREWNEKLATSFFPDVCPATLVSRRMQRLKDFVWEYGDVILKPLDGMGGASIFRLRDGDPNRSVILETLTQGERRSVMVQQYIPAIETLGDRRVLLIDGEPVPYVLARHPAQGETRGNLAAGGRGVGEPIREVERAICRRIGPKLREMGLRFVGIDVIGDYLTEINITSPTCIRELDAQVGLDIAGDLLDALARDLPTGV